MISEDKVAVIVPVFNVAGYLERCVETVIAQTYGNIEIILVDDKSTDSSSALCDELGKKDARVHVIHRLSNGGLSAARNSGIDFAIQESQSRWITFVDSDDWIHPRMIEMLVEGARRNDVLISVCSYNRVSRLTKFDNALVDFVKLTPEGFINACSNIPEKGVFLQNIACGKLFSVGLFENIRFPEHVKAHEDTYTTYKVIFSGNNIAFTDTCLYFYFLNQNSITGSAWSPNRLHTVWGHQEQIDFFDANGYQVALNIAIRQQMLRIPWVINKCMEAGGYEEEIEVLKKLLRDDFNKYKHKFNLSLVECHNAWRILRPIRAKLYIMALLLSKGPIFVVRKVVDVLKKKYIGTSA